MLAIILYKVKHFQSIPTAQMDNSAVKMDDALQHIGVVIWKMIVMTDQMKLTV